ncbi:hypothetical protein [Litorimonas sp. WD9-15]|uniref:hypothetical protein n=1 Tax=Litorimonas sp. WD9-15 TaxID=3418716 RepID=UPI003D090714
MNAKNWDDTLHLLCMMILVDGKVFEEEVEAFKDAAIALKDIVNPKLMLTRHMAGDWFALHRDDIAIRVSPVFYDSSLSGILKSLDTAENKKELIFALLKVAMSDGRKHISEQKLLFSACAAWNLDVDLAS